MEHIAGQEPGARLPSYSDKQKNDFAIQIRDMTSKMNIGIQNKAIPLFTQSVPLANAGWGDYPKSFCEDRLGWIRNMLFDDLVYVHGDLTAENMIIDDNGAACLIDFADSLVAPYYYEWMPLVYDLFACNPVMMTAYFGDYHNDAFYDQLTRSALIHEYAAGGIKDMCAAKGLGIDTLVDVAHLKAVLVEYLLDGECVVK